DRARQLGPSLGAVAFERVGAQLQRRELADLDVRIQPLPGAENGFTGPERAEKFGVVSVEDTVERNGDGSSIRGGRLGRNRRRRCDKHQGDHPERLTAHYGLKQAGAWT